jgi:hypothetical protein
MEPEGRFGLTEQGKAKLVVSRWSMRRIQTGSNECTEHPTATTRASAETPWGTLASRMMHRQDKDAREANGWPVPSASRLGPFEHREFEPVPAPHTCHDADIQVSFTHTPSLYA